MFNVRGNAALSTLSQQNHELERLQLEVLVRDNGLSGDDVGEDFFQAELTQQRCGDFL